MMLINRKSKLPSGQGQVQVQGPGQGHALGLGLAHDPAANVALGLGIVPSPALNALHSESMPSHPSANAPNTSSVRPSNDKRLLSFSSLFRKSSKTSSVPSLPGTDDSIAVNISHGDSVADTDISPHGSYVASNPRNEGHRIMMNSVVMSSASDPPGSILVSMSNNEPYNCCVTDCISLTTSEMTTNTVSSELHVLGPTHAYHPSLSSQIHPQSIDLERYDSVSELIDSPAHSQPRHKPQVLVDTNTSSASRLPGLLAFPKISRRPLMRLRRTNTGSYIPPNETCSHSSEDEECILETESDLNFDPKQEESEIDYKMGGYHPVCKGETYYSTKIPGREYVTVRKLGWGHFSTVWLAKSRCTTNTAGKDQVLNSSARDEAYVAIKFVKSSKNYGDAARDEIRILRALEGGLSSSTPKDIQGKEFVLRLLDDFDLTGPHGNHVCMVFEVLGENILNLLQKYKAFYSSLRKEFSRVPTEGNTLILSEDSIVEMEDESPRFKSSPCVALSPVLPPAASSLKFNKWDSALKKSTKSILSLGLSGRLSSKMLLDVPAALTSPPTSASNSSVVGDYSSSQKLAAADLPGFGNRIKAMNSENLLRIVERSKSCGGMPLNLVRQIVRQLLQGMDYVHRHEIIHTDLKPENILVQFDDLKLLIKGLEDVRGSAASSKSRGNSLSQKAGRRGHKDSFSKSSKCTACAMSVACPPSPVVRKSSLSSLSSSVGSCSYKLSRNSCSGKTECPIRSSKPLGTSISSDVFLRDSTLPSPPSSSYQPGPAPVRRGSTKARTRLPTPVRKPQEVSIKIADFGNATFSSHHFTNLIQTRQYRSPEIILKHHTWGASTDIWSIGCIIFEMITGDYLFDPYDSNCFSKDEDHLAQIIELLGTLPSDQFLVDCEATSKFFKLDSETNEVVLRNIRNLKYWGLKDVLTEKYGFAADDVQATLISDLILKCLRFNLGERFDCGSLLNHPWLKQDFDLVHYTDLLKNDPDALVAELDSLPSHNEEIPGFTSTCTNED